MFEVDPETYRYFFSASAQVFAAIFVVVAIALNFRLDEIRKRINDINQYRVKLAFFCKDWIDDKKLIEKFGESIDADLGRYVSDESDLADMKSQPWRYYEIMNREVLDSMMDCCNDIDEKSTSPDGVKLAKRIEQKILEAKQDEDKMLNQKDRLIIVVKRSVLLSSFIISLSLISLWLKYYCIYYVFGTLLAMLAVLFYISISFVSIYKTKA